MKAYKLTNSFNQSYNDTQWGEGVTHTATGTRSKLCSCGWIHFYTDPLIAVLMNSLHAEFINPKLWECETSGEHIHEPLKSGCKTLTTIKEIPLPTITDNQRVAFAILCAKVSCGCVEWNNWANKWLSGEDRSYESATKAVTAASYGNNNAWYAARAALSLFEVTQVEAGPNPCVHFAAYVARSIGFNYPRTNFEELARKALTYS